LHEERMLAMPRRARPGRRGRQDACAQADAARGVQRLRAQLQRPDAAVSEGNSLGRGPRRHPRLFAVDSRRQGLQEHPAAQPVDLDFRDSSPATKRNAPVARKTGTEPSAAPRPPKASGTAICVTLFAMIRMPSASPERPLGAWLYVRMMVSGCAEPSARPSAKAARASSTASCNAGRSAYAAAARNSDAVSTPISV